ncbi:MAG: AAA family ATPase [Spirochaetaceae bacterium]|jgi:predicted ATPase|nr:AAA family ATPase [Spirochaetaceae bacterium]
MTASTSPTTASPKRQTTGLVDEEIAINYNETTEGNRMTEQLCYYILTGAMGSGKSTIIECLLKNGTVCVSEPAREILREQKSIKADGVPEINPDLFTKLMLSRSIHNYKQNITTKTPVIFDRGIPDMIAYADLFRLDTKIYCNASEYYKYNNTVLLLNGWEDIYTTDDERKMTFEQANNFGNKAAEIYHKLGYNIIEVPKTNIEDRIKFIENIILNK